MAKKESVLQLGLWPDEPISANSEKRLDRLGVELGSYYYRHLRNTPITEEIKAKKIELRDRIGLPIARGKDPHVNDRFYIFLVKRICTFDTFGIFMEYDRVLDKVPPELDLKIKQVGRLVDELLNKGLNRPQRFGKFNQFVKDYQQRWNIPK